MAILKNEGDISEGENVRTTMTLGEQFELKFRVFDKGANSTASAPQKGSLVFYDTTTTFFAEAAVLYQNPDVSLPATVGVERGDSQTAAVVTVSISSRDIADRCVVNGEANGFSWSVFSVDQQAEGHRLRHRHHSR